MQKSWPEFLYRGLSIPEYVGLVVQENRNIKSEISALVDLVRDTAMYWNESADIQSRHITVICKAIQALLTLTENFGL